MKMRIELRAIILSALMFSMISLSISNAQLPPEIPREDTVICSLQNVMSDPYSFNPFIPGHLRMTGWHQCLLDVLWEVNVSYGEYNNELARAPPEPLNEEYTKWRIYLREGVYWSDGVEFTAEDVVFTLKMLASTPGLTVYSFWNDSLKDVVAVDKYTVDLELTKPFAKIQNYLGAQAYTVDTVPVPKHIWEGQDPTKFKFYPPVGTGPYVLKDVDPNGRWALWEKRSDWQRSSLGQMFDMSKAPKYALFMNYGTRDIFVLEMINHNLDVRFSFNVEEWETVRTQDPNATAWYEDFPWGCYDAGCGTFVAANWEKYPFNITDVRWALALSIDVVDLVMSWVSGMMRVTPCPLTSYGRHMELYHIPIREWLTNEFTLEDGYKPFDPDIPFKIAEAVKSELGYDVPTEDPDKVIDMFGVGWWKYDPEKAAELLEKHDFTRDADGKWHLPNGELWTFTTYAGVGDQFVKPNQIIAGQWNEFGIQAQPQALEGAVLGPLQGTGDFEVGTSSYVCNSPLDDVWGAINEHNPAYYKPVGEYTATNEWRYQNPEIQEIAEQLENLAPIDPTIPSIGLEGFKILVRDLAIISIGSQIRLMPYDSTYWKGWPTAENPYNNPACHRSAFTYTLVNLKPATEVTPPPPPPIIEIETIEEMQEAISDLTQEVTDLSASVSGLQTTVSELQTSMTEATGQTSMVNNILILTVVDLLIAIAAVILTITRR